MRRIIALWMVGTGIRVYQVVRYDRTMPTPSTLVGVWIIYGFAMVLAELSPQLGTVLAAGYTLAIAYGAAANSGGAPTTQATAVGQGAQAGTTATRTTGGRRNA